MFSISLAKGDISGRETVPGEIKSSSTDGLSRDPKLFKLEWSEYRARHSGVDVVLGG